MEMFIFYNSMLLAQIAYKDGRLLLSLLCLNMIPDVYTTEFIMGGHLFIVLTSLVWFAWKLRQSLPSGHLCPEVIERTQCSSQLPTQKLGGIGSVEFGCQAEGLSWPHHWTCRSGNHGLKLTIVVMFQLAGKLPCSCFPLAVVAQGTVAVCRGMVSDTLFPQWRKRDCILCCESLHAKPLPWDLPFQVLRWHGGFSVPHMNTLWVFTLPLTHFARHYAFPTIFYFPWFSRRSCCASSCFIFTKFLFYLYPDGSDCTLTA
jgi:hypothetical protein